jgi:hypothetical protein
MLKLLSCFFILSQIFLYADEYDSRLGGIKFDSTIGPAISLHQTFDIEDTNSTGKKIFLAGTEIGYWGGKLQIGYGHFDYLSIFGKLSLMRTWNNTEWVETDQTYLGTEVQFTAMLFNISLGLYQHVGGDSDVQQQIGSISIGIGW